MLAYPASFIPRDARGAWGRLSRNQRMTLAGVVGLAAILIGVFANSARTPEYGVAFSGLRDEEAAAIIVKLKDAKIPYDATDKGTIKVPPSQVQEVRYQMAAEGLPSKGSAVGMELFDQPRFGLTEFAEKINYQRALEGEIGRTIDRLDAVEASRVHLVVPQQSLFAAQQKDATASIVLEIKPGRKLDPGSVMGITQLVSGSVEGLKPQNITIMDAGGALLSDGRGNGDPARQTGNRSDVQRALEARLEGAIANIVSQVVPPNKSVVRVNADLDWDQYEANTTTFSPQNKQPQIRSQRQVTESQAGGAQAGGVPGTDTNVPTYPGGAAAGGQQSATERKDLTTNYELSSTIEKLNRAQGGLKRLSVAVAVDSESMSDPNVADGISKLLATASGVDVNRGDVITLTTLPFNTSTEKKLAEAVESARQRDLLLTIARLAAMALGPLVIILLVWFILRKGRARPVTQQGGVGVTTVDRTGALPAPAGAAGLASGALGDARGTRELAAPTENPEYERVRHELEQLARGEPAQVAQLIRTWMEEAR